MQLDWIRTKGKKATPFVVHLLMICGVAIYAIIGAVVMQNLEATPIDKEHSSRSFLEDSSSKKTRELAKNEDNEILKLNRHCLIRVLQKSMNDICSDSQSTIGDILYSIDSCYHVIINSKSVDSLHVIEKIIYNSETGEDEVVLFEEWSFSDSVLFAFTVITTIGYGNVAPKSFGGRMFCIFYGLIGIPFTLLAIADLGKFISEVMVSANNAYTVALKKIKKKFYKYKNNRYFGFFIKQIMTKSPPNSKKTSIYVNPEHVEDLENRFSYKEDINEAEKPLTSQKNNSKKKTSRSYSSKESIVNYEEKTSIIEFENGEKKEEDSDSEDEENDNTYTNQTCSLIGLFIIYIIIGAMMLSAYEPEMTFFNAIYFNFVSLTSIGLGDIVPKSQEYMFFTIIYIAIGLALTTIAIDIAADYLKKLHYFGRKIENVASVTIWFGGKKLTMGQLVKNLGDQFNLPITTIKNLNLDDFVDKAIKVEAGELESLRPPPLQPENIKTLEESVSFADGSNDWIPNDNEDFSLINTIEVEPTLFQPVPKIQTPIIESIPPTPKKETPPKTPTPEPKSPTPPPKTPTPEPRIPTPPKIETPEPEIEVPPPLKISLPEENINTSIEDYMSQKRRGYSEDAWRRYQEYQKQWQKLRQVKHSTSKSPIRHFSSVVETVADELKKDKNRKTSDISHLSSNGSTFSGSGVKFEKKKSLQPEMFRPISRNRSNLSSSSSTNKTVDLGKKKSSSHDLNERIGTKRSTVQNNYSPKNNKTDEDISIKGEKNLISSSGKGKPPSITSLSSRLSKGSR